MPILQLSHEIYGVNEYFQQQSSQESSSEAFTPSSATDSGNHSPTTTASSSDFYLTQQQLWTPQPYPIHEQNDSVFDDIQVVYDANPPPPADLEAIENLLNDKGALSPYNSAPDSIESLSNSPPLNTFTNNLVYQQVPKTSPSATGTPYILPTHSRASNRVQPYPHILPSSVKPKVQPPPQKQIKEETPAVQYIKTVTPHQQTYILNGNQLVS